MTPRPGWRFERHSGEPAALHAASAALVASAGVSPTVRLLEASSPAVVIGRAQPAQHLDAGRAGRAGIAIVRRASGGGAVLVVPGGAVWVDVVLPVGHRRWDEDVGRAAWWLGAAWAAALADAGAGVGEVHRGRFERRAWSDRVCFAGLGPGEVTVAGRKVVGISQRRTRFGALFQCCALVTWDPGPLVDLLALDDSERERARGELAGAAGGLGAEPAARLPRALAQRLG